MIDMRSVSFSYGDKMVISDFSFYVPSGGRVCIFGPSGAGKTTLLRLITGLEKPDSGSVEIDGRVSVVFQEDRLLPFKTVLQNAALFAAESDAVKMLLRLGLGGDTDKYPSELSGGMARRAALARALAVESGIYILDEPFDGLDEENIAAATALINERTAGKTLILVTHEREHAEKLGCELFEL